MADKPDFWHVLRASGIVIPTALLGAVIAGAVFLTDDMRADAASDIYPPITAGSVRDIQFVALTAEAVRPALEKACATTGCDASQLHPMIIASAAQMEPDELRLAIDAQARLMTESRRTLDAAAPGSDAYRIAALELEAARRISDLYVAQLENLDG